MKKVFKLFIIMIIFGIPLFVNAKEYEIDDMKYPMIIKQGDVIDFSESFNNYSGALYLDSHKMSGSDCYGNRTGCNSTFTADKDYVLEYKYYSSLYFLEYDSSKNYYSFDIDDSDLESIQDNHIYNSGDIIIFKYSNYSSFYYDENDTLITKKYNRYHDVIPQYNGKDISWKVSILDDGSYHFLAPYFKPYTYIPPEFSLKCMDKSINYGNKTKCYISVIAKEELREVYFNLNIPNFKITDIEYPNNLEKITGDREYNLRVKENVNLDSGMELMSFYLTGVKNESYTDDIKIVKLHYRDAVYSAEYDEIKSDLNIIPSKKITNPDTMNNILFILIPFLLLFISMTLVNKNDIKNKKKI